MGQTYGPVTRTDLQSLAGNGTIQSDTLVRSSAGDWRSADRVVLFSQRVTSESRPGDPDDPFADIPNATPTPSPHVKRRPQVLEDKFPNLSTYLLALEFWVVLVFRLVEGATICVYILGMAFILVGGLGGAFSGVASGVRSASASESAGGFFVSIIFMVFAMILLTAVGAVIVALNRAIRIVSMAGIEFVRVQVAIERNTRELLSR